MTTAILDDTREAENAGSELSNPLDNPDVFGFPIRTLIEGAIGLTATAGVNDKLVGPNLAGVLPMMPRSANNTEGQLYDAGTTALSAWVTSKVAGLVFGKRVETNTIMGGLFLAAGKFLAAFIPGLSISAQFPDVLPAFRFPGVGPAAAPPAALPASQPGLSYGRIVAGSMGV